MSQLFFAALLTFALQAQTIYVDDNGSANGNGSSQSPFNNIPAAVALANTLGSRPTIRIQPGVYPIASTIRIEKSIELRGSNEMQVDSQGWPLRNVTAGTEAILVGTAALGNNPMIVFSKPGQVITNIDVRDLSFEAAPGAGSIMEFARVQDFEVRNSIFVGSTQSLVPGAPGLQTFASTGTIRDNFMSGLLGGAFIHGGYPASPAEVIFERNRVVRGRVGVFLVGTSDGITDPGNFLSSTVKNNDISDNNSGNNSAGLRIIIKGNEALPGYGSTGLSSSTIQATVQNNRLVGNTTGISIDAGFVTRLLPPFSSNTCDTRTFSGMLALNLRDNTLTGNTRPAVLSFTQLQVTLGLGQLARLQYLHNAEYRIEDRDYVLAGQLLDHPATDPFLGGPCASDIAREPLVNALWINGLLIPNTAP
jgi:hypothetical protein